MAIEDNFMFDFIKPYPAAAATPPMYIEDGTPELISYPMRCYVCNCNTSNHEAPIKKNKMTICEYCHACYVKNNVLKP